MNGRIPTALAEVFQLYLSPSDFAAYMRGRKHSKTQAELLEVLHERRLIQSNNGNRAVPRFVKLTGAKGATANAVLHTHVTLAGAAPSQPQHSSHFVLPACGSFALSSLCSLHAPCVPCSVHVCRSFST